MVSATDQFAIQSQDNTLNHGPHNPGNYIRTNAYACSAIAYTWKFTRVDVPELPIEYNTSSGSTFVRISDVLGTNAPEGGVFDVQVKPIFANGQESVYCETEQISIIGAAGIQGGSSEEDAAQDQFFNTSEGDEFNAVSMKIYPNPSSGITQIELLGLEKNEQVTSLRITDALGRVVMDDFEFNEDGSAVSVNVSVLPAGTYFVRCTLNDHLLVERIIVL